MVNPPSQAQKRLMTATETTPSGVHHHFIAHDITSINILRMRHALIDTKIKT